MGQDIADDRKAPPIDTEVGEALFKAETTRKFVYATVTDDNGKTVTKLPPSAFKVFEDGKEVEIKSFSKERLPSSLCLDIDRSGSMRNSFQNVNETLNVFVRQLISKDTKGAAADEFCVVDFGNEPILRKDLPTPAEKKDPAKELAKVNKVLFEGNDFNHDLTRMRDAVGKTIARLDQYKGNDRKAIVLITDGNDNDSKTSLDQLLSFASSKNVMVYPIGVFKEPVGLNNTARDNWFSEVAKAKDALTKLADVTGGNVHFLDLDSKTKPKDQEKLTNGIFRELDEQLRSVFEIGIAPTEGKDHSVKVEANTLLVNGKTIPLTVKFREKYFSQTTEAPAKKDLEWWQKELATDVKSDSK